jgi:hypothetical protein
MSRSEGSPPPTRLQRGDVVRAKSNHVCMDTDKGLTEFLRWMDRGDKEEMARTLIKYGGQMVSAGDQLKILAPGVLSTTVRVLSTGRECDVVSA